MLDFLSAAAAGAPPGWIQFLPLVGMVVIFWFLIIRPQMKRGDQVVTAGGLVGKVLKVDDAYVELELGQGVKVKAVKQTIADIILPGGSPAND